jgi:hypothetical protein
MGQVVECLSSKREALSSKSGTTKKKSTKKKIEGADLLFFPKVEESCSALTASLVYLCSYNHKISFFIFFLSTSFNK